MEIKRFVFNPFQVNCYILFNETGECIIIDPAVYYDDEKHKILQFIDDNCPKPQMIINTHGHVDHVCGNKLLKEKYSLKTCIHKDDTGLLNIAVEQGLFFGIQVSKPPEPEVLLENKQLIELADSVFEIRHVPGHSPGSVAIYSEKDKFIVTGDVLFKGSIGRTDLLQGDHDTLLNSIKQEILSLPDEIQVYPGHGESTSIGNERRSNPFLQ